MKQKIEITKDHFYSLLSIYAIPLDEADDGLWYEYLFEGINGETLRKLVSYNGDEKHYYILGDTSLDKDKGE